MSHREELSLPSDSGSLYEPHLDLPQRNRARVRQRHSTRQNYSPKLINDRAGDSSRIKTSKPSRTEKSLLEAALNDGWSLFKVVLRLYPLWKWLLAIYLLVLLLSYSVAGVYRFAVRNLKPVCDIPLLGQQIPFCALQADYDRQINVKKVIKSQNVLPEVMGRVGQSFEAATSMVHHDFALRDLKIRVSASSLSRAQELTRELEALSRHTKLTAKGLSSFTAKTHKTVDAVATFDDYAARALQKISDRQEKSQRLPDRIFSAIQPFGAWDLVAGGRTEEEVKILFMTTATRMSEKVGSLLQDSFEQFHNLENINAALDRIKELCQEEFGDIPAMNVLSTLWKSLARPNDYEEYKSHLTLLQDMTQLYDNARHVVIHTTAALNRMEAEINEFRDDFATPGLILRDYPLEVIIVMLRKAAQRLEAGSNNVEYIAEA